MSEFVGDLITSHSLSRNVSDLGTSESGGCKCRYLWPNILHTIDPFSEKV